MEELSEIKKEAITEILRLTEEQCIMLLEELHRFEQNKLETTTERTE